MSRDAWPFCWLGEETNLDVGEPGIIRRLRKPDHAGSNPAIQTANGRASRLATAPGPNPDERRALRVRLPLLPLSETCPWPSGQAPASHAGQAGSTPAGHSDRLIFDNAADDWPGRQPADHPCSNQGMLRVQLPPGPLTRCPGGPARSGRHALTVESMGSNPIQGTDPTCRLGTGEPKRL